MCAGVEISDRNCVCARDLFWYEEFYPALKAGRSEKKMLLILCIESNSSRSNRSSSDIFENSEVKSYIKPRFICMKADANNGDGSGIKQKYLISKFPCILLVEPNGKEFNRISAYLKPPQFLQELHRLIDDKTGNKPGG
jgi:thioredoxin-related protein